MPKINYDTLKTASAIPNPSSMIETFRAIGYSLETAIADIIDNSISAGAKSIYVKRQWEGDESYIIIKDDGCGMNTEEIIQAMRPGSINPLEERDETDLGRFGLGLKTASFSQCRKLTVVSKKAGYHSIYWTWDLDYVAQIGEWKLIQWIPEGLENILDDVTTGTAVIWSDLDRIIPNGTDPDNFEEHVHFSEALEKVKEHIAMTFHRFIEDKDLKLFWESYVIEPWDPFCLTETKTQSQPQENIKGGIEVKGYILPHKKHFSSEQAYKRAEGINGWPAQQGFYVYRGKRLLLAGDWLGLFRKEEHYKLVRIRIDLPNTHDQEWQIDIKKSKAYPPMIHKDQLEAYAKNCRRIGQEVFRHRGVQFSPLPGMAVQPLWKYEVQNNLWHFVVNRNHDMIKRFKELAKTKPNTAIDKLLKFIEETIPTKNIFMNESKSSDEQREPFASDVDMRFYMQEAQEWYEDLLADGFTPEEAKDYLKIKDPFHIYPNIIDAL